MKLAPSWELGTASRERATDDGPRTRDDAGKEAALAWGLTPRPE